MGRGAEAAARYVQYLDKYPNGERIETAHLNIIDGYRESTIQRRIAWIDRTRQRFSGTPVEQSAVFARLRLDIALGDWNHATQPRTSYCRGRLRKTRTPAPMKFCI
jgi:hypothetical protein